MSVVRATLSIDVARVAPAGVKHVVADVFTRRELSASTVAPPAVAICCLPGGGMSRRYFDLDVPAELGNYSMARHLAQAGFVVVTLDHPGIGDSDRPDDGYTLDPGTVADVNHVAFATVIARLRDGTASAEVAPVPDVVSIGLGHSMGALLTVHQQARHPSHSGLALLGFSGGGLRSQLNDAELAVADNPAAARAALVELTRARWGEPLPRGSTATSPMLVRGDPPAAALEAIGASSTSLLALCGLTSMLPGASRAELDAIDVPVFLGVGELDITGPPHAIPAHFPASRDVTLFVLPDSGHNHNVDAGRVALWDRVARWARDVGNI